MLHARISDPGAHDRMVSGERWQGFGGRSVAPILASILVVADGVIALLLPLLRTVPH